MKRRDFLICTAIGGSTWLYSCGKGSDGPGGGSENAGGAGGAGTTGPLDTGGDVPVLQHLTSDWRFLLDDAGESAADADFDDSDWAAATLPHPARIEALETGPQGSDTFQWQGTCWYRTKFTLDEAAADRRVFLLFGAAMNVADVWLDGEHLGEHLGGFLPFGYDVSALVEPGREHTLAVRLDNRDDAVTGPRELAELDFNYYHGLYRDVRLVTKARLYITDPLVANRPASGGVFVTYPQISPEEAQIRVEVHVRNDDHDDRDVGLRLTLLDTDGSEVASSEYSAGLMVPASDAELTETLTVANPALWSPRQPNLYTLRVELVGDGDVVDEEVLRIGIRHLWISPSGLLVNFEKVVLRGVNRHQEYPYVGYALSDDAQYRDARMIKEAGFDFVRLSHYPQSRAFLDACDELGIIVMNCIPGSQLFNDTEEFRAAQLANCETMIRRDRNHPCVILWEVALNEADMPNDFVAAAHETAHREYPGDQCFSAGWTDGYDVFLQARHDGGCTGITDRACLVNEYGDREFYEDATDTENSRQLRWHGEAALLQQAANFQRAHNDNRATMAFADGLAAMFDYNRGSAVDIQSAGCMDIFRLPKFSHAFFRSQRDPDEEYEVTASGPMVFIASHWTEESAIDVKVFSNCEEVELSLNGTLVARQEPDTNARSENLAHPPFTFAVAAFESGTLEAVGYVGGAEVARHSVSTPGPIAELALSLDEGGKAFAANGKDMVFVHARLLDDGGTTVPDAWENVSFGATGEAELAGANPFSSDGGIASILLQAESAEPEAAVYALCIVPETDAFRVVGASVAAGTDPADFEIRVTLDGSRPGATSDLYEGPVTADRVRAALVVDGEVVTRADSNSERFRVQGSVAPT